MTALFPDADPLAARQPKTDRLILGRFLLEAANDQRIRDEAERAHPILVHWADLEASGKLDKLNETQLQGDFLAQVFGDALGYRRPTGGHDAWTLEQHHTVAGQTPDAVLGRFGVGREPEVLGVVELKGAKIHPDRDRSNGRTAVDQCWDYLVNTPPACRWGIVSNLVSFRLYERNSTKRRYEHFALQSLRDPSVFRQFYALFHSHGLVAGPLGVEPRAAALLAKTGERQRAVGDELYELYSRKRVDLIRELHVDRKHGLDDAIEWAQRLFDRVIFIAFCEDRGLLPTDTLKKAHAVSGFSAVTNPRWQSFKALFRMIDAGRADADIPAYNGGLFRKGPVDDLELDDARHTDFFKSLGDYDFADEVNLDVLGHLFEQSITEVEKLRETGFFGGDADKAAAFATMPRSAKRKRLGIYYTPPELTARVVRYAVDELVAERLADAGDDPLAQIDALRRVKSSTPPAAAGPSCSRPTTPSNSATPRPSPACPRRSRRTWPRRSPASSSTTTFTAWTSRPRRSRSRSSPCGSARPTAASP